MYSRKYINVDYTVSGVYLSTCQGELPSVINMRVVARKNKRTTSR